MWVPPILVRPHFLLRVSSVLVDDETDPRAEVLALLRLG
jgi:hypothetical protein